MDSKIIETNLQFREELIPLDRPRRIIVHHTHNENLDVYSTHKMHIERFGWAGIGYNYIIDKEGKIYEGRGLHVGAHAKGNNKDSIGIAMIGNLDLNNPTVEQYNSLKELILYFMFKYDIEINRCIGHRELENVEKTCPGDLFSMDDFRTEIKELLLKCWGGFQ